jgi:hypothetical protein
MGGQYSAIPATPMINEEIICCLVSLYLKSVTCVFLIEECYLLSYLFKYAKIPATLSLLLHRNIVSFKKAMDHPF